MIHSGITVGLVCLAFLTGMYTQAIRQPPAPAPGPGATICIKITPAPYTTYTATPIVPAPYTTYTATPIVPLP